MPSSVLHVNTTVTCFHAGTVTSVPTQARVRVGGNFVATENDITSIKGCTGPQMSLLLCLSVGWIDVAKRVRVMGSRVLLASSQGVGQAAPPIPGGSPLPVPNGSVVIIDPMTPVKGT